MPDPAVVTAPANVDAPAAASAPNASPGTSQGQIPGNVVFNFGGMLPSQPAAQDAPQARALATPALVTPTTPPAVVVAPDASEVAKPAPEGELTHAQALAKLAEYERGQLRNTVASAVVAKARPDAAKLVRGLLAGIEIKGDADAASESALAALTQEYPELFATGEGSGPTAQAPARMAPQVPSLPAALHSPNGVQVQRIGFYNAKGQRVL